MKKILIVDDEEDVLSLVKRALERTGQYQVVATASPKDVFGLCQREEPDLILLDIVMPDLKGTEVLKILKADKKTRTIPVVITSGLGEMVYNQKRDKWKWNPNQQIIADRGEVIKEKNADRAAAAYGVDDYLHKPFSQETLRQVVEDVLSRGRRTSVDEDDDFEE